MTTETTTGTRSPDTPAPEAGDATAAPVRQVCREHHEWPVNARGRGCVECHRARGHWRAERRRRRRARQATQQEGIEIG